MTKTIRIDWENRGKSVKQLITELQTFEDQTLEVVISSDGKTFQPISLVGRHEGKSALMYLGDRPPQKFDQQL